MARAYSTDHDNCVAELSALYKHPVYQRLIAASVEAGHRPAYIQSLLGFVSNLFAQCRKRKTHGHLPMSRVKKLRVPRTLDRYLALLLDQDDGEGGKDFYLLGGTLFVPHFHCSVEAMHKAELAYAQARAKDAARQRRHRSSASCQTTPNTMPLRVLCDADFDVSRPLEVSVLEEKDPTDTSARSESVEDVGRERPEVQRALTSLEITEAALAEERRDAEEAAKKVARQPSRQAPSPVPKPPPEPLPRTLERWGYRPALVAKHRFTERELNLAVEKVEAAKTPLGNRAGAVVATILRWRTGQWQVAA